jgi:hypothetical protein
VVSDLLLLCILQCIDVGCARRTQFSPLAHVCVCGCGGLQFLFFLCGVLVLSSFSHYIEKSIRGQGVCCFFHACVHRYGALVFVPRDPREVLLQEFGEDPLKATTWGFVRPWPTLHTCSPVHSLDTCTCALAHLRAHTRTHTPTCTLCP